MSAGGQLGGLNFPNWTGFSGQVLNSGPDRDVNLVMIRAYNDWHIDEWCGAYPGRFVPLALSGFVLGDEWMAGEVHRVPEKGCHAVSFPSEPHRFGAADFHGTEWDKAWQACNDIGTVAVFHFGGFPTFMPRTPFSVIPHAMPFQTAIFAAELLWSPIMQKFPKLKMSLAEGGIGWVPYFLEKAHFV